MLPATVVDVLADWERAEPLLAELAAAAARSRVASREVAGAALAAPLLYPGKILCAGANYYDHMAEMGFPDVKKETQRLFFFFKPPRNAVVGPGATVVMPSGTKKFDWEIELAAVIGKTARALRLGRAGARPRRRLHRSPSTCRRATHNRAPDRSTNSTGWRGRRPTPAARWGRGSCRRRRSSDPQNVGAEAFGQRRRQAGRPHHRHDLLGRRADRACCPSIMTLDPGDVVLTGTPAGVGVPKQHIPVGRRQGRCRDRGNRQAQRYHLRAADWVKTRTEGAST